VALLVIVAGPSLKVPFGTHFGYRLYYFNVEVMMAVTLSATTFDFSAKSLFDHRFVKKTY